MQHIPFHTLVIALTVSAASAGPLTLTQDGVPVSGLAGAGVAVSPNRPVNPVPAQAYAQTIYAQATYAQAPYAQAPARQVAANGPNLGGGFFEVLFGGAGNRDAPPRYEPAQRYETNFGMAPSAEPAQPAVDPRYLKQEVHYGGNERPGTSIIKTNEKLLYLVEERGNA